MTATIRIHDDLYNQARTTAKLEHRSINGQIEYWTRLGRVCEENPDLPLQFIKQALKGLEDIRNHNFSEFKFDD